MTVEDRLRATTGADHRRHAPGPSADLAARAAGAGRPRRSRARPPRRWPGWLVPIAAAAAVIAVAATLVTVRGVQTADPSSPAPATSPSVDVSSAMPAYYVQLGAFKTGTVGHPDAVVADDRTGRVLATVKAPAGLVFEGVAGTVDDRTFVLNAVSATTDFSSQTPPRAGNPGSCCASRRERRTRPR